MQRSRKRWLAWWYLAIAVGFAILMLDHVLLRDGPDGIAVRGVIAAGFGLLSWMELNKK